MIYMMVGGAKTWEIMPGWHKVVVGVADCIITAVVLAMLARVI